MRLSRSWSRLTVVITIWLRSKPRTTAHGPLLQGRETGLTGGSPVMRLVLLEQAVAHQKRDAALAHFDRRNHCHTP